MAVGAQRLAGGVTQRWRLTVRHHTTSDSPSHHKWLTLASQVRQQASQNTSAGGGSRQSQLCLKYRWVLLRVGGTVGRRERVYDREQIAGLTSYDSVSIRHLQCVCGWQKKEGRRRDTCTVQPPDTPDLTSTRCNVEVGHVESVLLCTGRAARVMRHR